MDLNLFNTVIGVVGLFLGFLASYKQLKAIGLRALNATGARARRWAQKQDDLANLYLEYTSAFVAYIAQAATFNVLALFVVLVARPSNLAAWGVPTEWVRLMAFVPPALSGVLLGSLSSTCASVRQAAAQRTQPMRTSTGEK